MGGLYKRAEAGLATILIIVIIVFFLGWLINVGQRECKSNRDCDSESYCGSDFSCHPYPTIQKTIVQYNLLFPSIIIGVAIIIVAIIFNWSRLKTKEESQQIVPVPQTEAPEAEEITEPYYKSNGNVKTP